MAAPQPESDLLRVVTPPEHVLPSEPTEMLAIATSIASMAEDIHRTADLSIAFRQAASERAVRISELTAQNRSLTRELAAARRAQADANALVAAQAARLELVNGHLRKARANTRRLKRQLEQVENSRLVRLARHTSAARRRLRQAFGRG